MVKNEFGNKRYQHRYAMLLGLRKTVYVALATKLPESSRCGM